MDGGIVMIYLDNAATTQIHPDVLNAMMPYLTNEYGNAGAMYGLGRRAATAVASARQQVANLIGCKPSNIIFTSGGSEANSLVFAGAKPYLLSKGKTHIITSSVEHDSVLKTVANMCNSSDIKPAFYATFLGVNNKGEVSVSDLHESISSHTGLVSVMYVNNETGSVNPAHEIGDFCKNKNILFHTDCVQAIGFQNINVDDIGCDFLSISSHKIHAPKGVGALYVRDLSILSPMIHGGTEQEFGYRGGTENVAGIVGFGKACEIINNNFEANKEKTIRLKSLFEQSLKEHLDTYKLRHLLHINSPYRDNKILNIRFENIDGQTLLLMLDSAGVCVSAGSACRSHESEPSHVLTAMGLSPDEARDSIRISFSSSLSNDEILYSSKIMADCVAILTRNNRYIDDLSELL